MKNQPNTQFPMTVSEYTGFDPEHPECSRIAKKGDCHYLRSMVYFLYWKRPDGKLMPIYAGQTKRGFDRICEHLSNGLPVDEWFYIPLPDFPELLDEVEKYYIQKYRFAVNQRMNMDLKGLSEKDKDAHIALLLDCMYNCEKYADEKKRKKKIMEFYDNYNINRQA